MSGTTVTVYVLEDCPGYERAHRLVQEIRARWPGVEVNIVDLGAMPAPPAAVIGVPSWFLNGHVFSLGNPDLTQLAGVLDAVGGWHGPA